LYDRAGGVGILIKLKMTKSPTKNTSAALVEKTAKQQIEKWNDKAAHDYPELIFVFDASGWRVPNAIATDGHSWFLCEEVSIENEVPRTEMTEVSLAGACRWYADCNRFTDGGRGDIAPLLADVAKALEGKAAS
jgi:hypothetical protein